MANKRKAGKKTLTIWTSERFLKKLSQLAKASGKTRKAFAESIIVEKLKSDGLLPSDYDPAFDLPGSKKKSSK